MARPPRLESNAGVYHVLNRGNYRSDIFGSDPTKASFLRCLEEACAKTGWRVHAWCVMSNHYHLAVSTPEANLVAGMQWLQGTWAKRFNRIRRERGHLFQGRYKSLLVDPAGGLGPLCHYIHLNPVRACLCKVPELVRYPWTSLAWLRKYRHGPAWYDPLPALLHAGELRWTKTGVAKYVDYLAWLAEDEPAQKELRFVAMTKGWIIGTRKFAQDLLRERKELGELARLRDGTLGIAQEQRWQDALAEGLRAAQRTDAELRAAPKSAAWKLELAAQLRTRTTATNRWLGAHLHMGARDEVSRNLTAWARRQAGRTTDHRA